MYSSPKNVDNLLTKTIVQKINHKVMKLQGTSH